MAEDLQLQAELQDIGQRLKAVVDKSAALKAKGGESERMVTKAWEQFLGDFLGYVRQKSQQISVNLLAGISLPKWR